MTGIILDSVLLLMLVVALGYGVRLERKLTALRAGQLAFAGAVTELNTAAGRAEAALSSLRASGEEADLLHDRLIKAREVKTQLEALIARAPTALSPRLVEATPVSEVSSVSPLILDRPVSVERPITRLRERQPLRETTATDDKALRMAALAERIHGLAQVRSDDLDAPASRVSAIVSAMTANHAVKRTPNRPRRSVDEDLFAA